MNPMGLNPLGNLIFTASNILTEKDPGKTNGTGEQCNI
jgi:hypothetical protein